MKILRLQFEKYFTSDELSFGARILNFVCFLATLAALAALIARIVGGMPPVTILAMGIVFIALVCVFFLTVKRAKKATVITTVALYALGLVFWPVIFFTNGGAMSGAAPYFMLIIILDFLLLKGRARIGALILTSAAVVFCYGSTLLFGWDVLPAGGLSGHQIFVDGVQSIIVAGFFMGFVLVFQNGVYLKEKNRAEAAGAEILRGDELLTLVNEAATLLLTAEPDTFEETITESMRKIGECLNIDCVYIWRTDERDGIPSYILLYHWFSPHADEAKSFRAVTGSNIIPRSAEWDDKLFGARGFIADRLDCFGGSLRETLAATGVQAIMAFPVFFQGQYWGFVTFENRHSDRLCTEREAAILKSGSLLLANAVERNDSVLQLNERLAQQQLMSDISNRFITREPMGSLIQGALARMGAFLQVERVLIAVFEKDSEVSRPEYVWFSDPKFTPNQSQKGFSGILKELFPRRQAEDCGAAGIYCDDALTHAGGKFKIFHERSGLRSFICIPIYVDGELWGAISIEEHERLRRWNENDRQLVSMVTSAISSAVARDMMDRERADALDQAIAASRAKGDFLSNMSHEIRTPMNAIIGMTAIGKASQAADKKDYAFDKIDSASKHLLGVINDILDMSKIEANKLELSPVSFEFESMMKKVANVINFRVDERRQRFYINIDNKIPRYFVGDDQRLAQVLTNLLSNAVKFTPEGGAIHLNATLLTEDAGVCRLQIEVEDTGIGISDEQKARLFHSFEQAEAGTSRKYGGTGLGLAISKRIVELMDGEIWVESELGRGSKFTFAVSLQCSVNAPGRLLAEGVDWSNIRLFAVDDEAEIRAFFLRFAENLGVHCKVCASGEEATEHLAREDGYDVYFVDWNLPGMNGIELARQIRVQTKSRSIVILFSSIEWSVIEDDARDAGVDKFLPKPLFPSAIVDLINECIGHKRAVEQDAVPVVADDFTGRVILLAEDVEINREIVMALLEPTHMTVDCAADGKQALALFTAAPDKYDMIFMDVQMPEMDGYEATRRIRALDTPRAKDIPIVAMTANVFREDIERCLEAGMNDHVGKPLDIEEVLTALRMYLSVSGGQLS